MALRSGGELFDGAHRPPTVGGSGPVAQWLEQATHNRSVAGSIPARPTALTWEYLVHCVLAGG